MKRELGQSGRKGAAVRAVRARYPFDTRTLGAVRLRFGTMRVTDLPEKGRFRSVLEEHSMRKWRHHRVEVKTWEQMDAMLDECGRNGWELVHVGRVLEDQEKDDTMTEALSEPKSTESWMLYFKQPVEG